MRFMLSLITVFVFSNSFSQTVEDRISELQKNGIDTILQYNIEAPCLDGFINFNIDSNGVHSRTDSCLNPCSKYLIWKSNSGIYFKQKIEECKLSKTAKVAHKNSIFLNLCFRNTDIIIKTKLKPVEYHVNDSMSVSQTVSHSKYYRFDLVTGNTEITKVISDFKLNTKYINNDVYKLSNDTLVELKKYPNNNYEYNQNTILKKLIDLVEEEIKGL